MGRKAKYATYAAYKPYIDVIMKDLGLTDKVALEWVFGTWRSKGGSALLSMFEVNGKRTGTVHIEIHQGHAYTLKILMHELMHIKQYYENRLSVSYHKPVYDRRGKVTFAWYIKWQGKEMPLLNTSRNTMMNNRYRDQPWEKEAYAYMDEVARLFPNNQLPETKKLVGVVGNVKFFKTAA